MTRLIEKTRINHILGLAITMTTAAEFIYFIVWGVFLFPEGNLTSKLVWTIACGVGMGAVIGAGVLVFAEGGGSEQLAFWGAALIMAAVGMACSLLCGRIDVTFNYFGVRDEPLSFLLSGIGPAIIGGLVFGWLLRIHAVKMREMRRGCVKTPNHDKVQPLFGRFSCTASFKAMTVRKHRFCRLV